MKEIKKNANGGAENESTGAEKAFDEILKNKKYQSEFDRRVQKAIKTAKRKWKQENEGKKAEIETKPVMYIKFI